MQRRLGRSWQTLHRIVYVAAPLGVLHFWWLVKADVSRPAQFAFAVAVLLGFRIVWKFRHVISTPVTNLGHAVPVTRGMPSSPPPVPVE